jgi:hypothetical protein
MKTESKKHLPLAYALFWIVGSSFIISCLAHKGIRHSFLQKRKAFHESLAYVVQTSVQNERLHSDYFCELLHLSHNRPTSYGNFDEKKAQEIIEKSPIIEHAFVKKIKPNMVYIDYALRKPLVYVADFINAALDREGILFPVHPFFSPKMLPEIYFGNAEMFDAKSASFGSSVKGAYFDSALLVLDALSRAGKDLFFVKRIDVSKLFSPSLGRREIVVTIENELSIPSRKEPVFSTHYLRLSHNRYNEEIAHYMQLRNPLLEAEKQECALSGAFVLKEKTVDLRLSQLAFIQ